ncbi:MAG: hypothetical protein JWO05_206 [Gemmatimonadetes bacterium]|nr:hypothetical protein [Gemmatimonadota bacterium]
MAHRTIRDSLGTQWQVWETRPGPRSKVSPQLMGGWLTFESVTSPPLKRRLVPIPAGWEGTTDSGLLEMLIRSHLVLNAKRTTAEALEESSAPPEKER